MPARTPSPGDLEPIERCGRDELRALQLQRLKWSLLHAYDNVPHYRRKFEAHGVHPDDLRSLEDLVRFPFTTKQDLRESYPFGMFAVARDQIVRIHASSGTTRNTGSVGNPVELAVASRMTSAARETPATPLLVTIRVSMISSCCPRERWMPDTCATKIAATLR